MSRRLLSGISVIVLLLLTGCTATLPEGDSGSIALMPFFNDDHGISGVVPAGCTESSPGNFDCPDLAVMVQQAYPGPLEELVDLLLPQLSVEQLPEPVGGYKGRAFDWDLYSLVARIEDSGFDVLRVELALAEEGARSYIVALVTLPEAYEGHPELYDTIFTHAVYGLMPWE
jgi:hypothetical protein